MLVFFASIVTTIFAAKPPFYGKVKVVKHYADYKVKVVTQFPDLKVKKVDFFADEVGEWTFVKHHEDFSIQYVDYGEDFSIMFVDQFPGLPDGRSRLKGRRFSCLLIPAFAPLILNMWSEPTAHSIFHLCPNGSVPHFHFHTRTAQI